MIGCDFMKVLILLSVQLFFFIPYYYCLLTGNKRVVFIHVLAFEFINTLFWIIDYLSANSIFNDPLLLMGVSLVYFVLSYFAHGKKLQEEISKNEYNYNILISSRSFGLLNKIIIAFSFAVILIDMIVMVNKGIDIQSSIYYTAIILFSAFSMVSCQKIISNQSIHFKR